jgi:TM2 domain-containing membrane protein YozV
MFCKQCGKEIPEGTLFCSYCGARQVAEETTGETSSASAAASPVATTVESKSKIAAGVLAILLGSLGIHKFYLGYTTQGLIMLLVTVLASWFTLGLAAIIMEVIGLIEGIIYLTMSDEAFRDTYVIGRKAWF